MSANIRLLLLAFADQPADHTAILVLDSAITLGLPSRVADHSAVQSQAGTSTHPRDVDA